MTPTEQKAFDAALLAAHATHRYWLVTHAVCEAIFDGDREEIKQSHKANQNLEAYAEQSKALSAQAVELAEALEN